VNIPTKSQESGLIDRSNYVASITTLNGCLNGGIGSYCLGWSEETWKFERDNKYGCNWLSDKYLKVMKAIIILQNVSSLSLTKDKVQEVVIKQMRFRYY